MHTVNAAALKIPYLYHYQPYRLEWIKQILLHSRLYFSNPAKFNDPWDFRPNFNSKILDDPLIYERHVQWVEASSRKHAPFLTEDDHRSRAKMAREDRNFLEYFVKKMSEELSQTASNRYRVFCLSTAADNPLMWSHYAEGRTGLCLEFRCRSYIAGSAIRVDYRKSYPAFDLSDNDSDIVLLPWTTKSDVWSYENEFRIIAQERATRPPDEVLQARNGVVKFSLNELRSIILGCLISQKAESEIRSLVERQVSPQILLKKMIRSPDRYDLVTAQTSITAIVWPGFQ